MHGILVQLPLPNHIDGHKIIEEIDPKKMWMVFMQLMLEIYHLEKMRSFPALH